MNENKNSFLIFFLYFEYVILYKNIIEMCVMIEENFVLIFSYKLQCYVFNSFCVYKMKYIVNLIDVILGLCENEDC